MGKIVAIGGGELSQGQTEMIDKFIVGLSEKEVPKLLFIPTASSDAEGYVESVKRVYGDLGCKVDALYLVNNSEPLEVIREQIMSADIIYVGGGDTVKMMEIWTRLGVDKLLREAYDKGIVMSGLSAGSICWFEYGHSDSNSFRNKGHWDYIQAKGLGLIKALHCPHYNEPGREGFDKMMENEELPGIALEDKTAFVEIDGLYSIIKSDEKYKAYCLRNLGNQVHKEEILEGDFKF